MGVFSSFPQLASLDLIWLAATLIAQAAHFACTFALQRIALRTKAWFPVVTAQLAGNSISLIMPGGAAAGAAVQFRMLATSGMDAGEAVGGLTAFSLLGVAGLLALPLFALPAILLGTPINRSLFDAALVGMVGFVLFAGFSATLLVTDRPLEAVGQAIQWTRNRLMRRRAPLTGLESQLVTQRDLIRGVLGEQWWQAVLLSAGRLAFDFLSLLCALRAVGSRPSPSLVLIAYAVTGVIGLIPITPGGLGIVEASLSWVPGPGRRGLGGGRAGHAHLPAGLVLVAPAGRALRLRHLQAALPKRPTSVAGPGCPVTGLTPPGHRHRARSRGRHRASQHELDGQDPGTHEKADSNLTEELPPAQLAPDAGDGLEYEEKVIDEISAAMTAPWVEAPRARATTNTTISVRPPLTIVHWRPSSRTTPWVRPGSPGASRAASV